MRMSITLDKELLEETQRFFGVKSKNEAIRKALEEAVRQKRREQALSHQGRLDLGVTAEQLAEYRSLP